jgi:hypothetical protein
MAISAAAALHHCHTTQIDGVWVADGSMWGLLQPEGNVDGTGRKHYPGKIPGNEESRASHLQGIFKTCLLLTIMMSTPVAGISGYKQQIMSVGATQGSRATMSTRSDPIMHLRR